MNYDVFISYSHEDESLAERLSRRIRSYRPPRGVARKRPRFEVFRDVERLTASTNLTNELKTRINASKHLVVLCSPSAARSEYVDQEIAAFLNSNNGSEHITVLLCEGEPAESIPARLRKEGQEPLFIDLRDSNLGLAGFLRFRLETLRLMAKLLDVDYSDLYRDDVRRNRRRWMSWCLLLALLTVAVSAQLIVTSVPAASWKPIALPTHHQESPVMPVKHIAVNNAHPYQRLYFVFDAKVESGKSDIPSEYLSRINNAVESGFQRSVLEYLNSERGSGAGNKPVAIVEFQVKEFTDITGQGVISVFAFLDRRSGKPRYTRSLKFKSKSMEGLERELVLDKPKASHTVSPFDFYPWPVNHIREQGLLWDDYGGISGTLIDQLSGARTGFVIEFEDVWESIDEACDGLCFYQAILAHPQSKMIAFDGESQALSEMDHTRETWQKIVNSPEWSTYHDPEITDYRLHPGFPVEGDVGIADMARQIGGDAALALAIDNVLQERRNKNTYDENLEVKMISRQVEKRRLHIASVLSMLGGMGAAYQWTEREAFHFIRLEPDKEWKPLRLPRKSPGNIIIDVNVMGDNAKETIVTTDRDGLYCASGNMDKWVDCNYGESRMTGGGRIKVISAGYGKAVYVLLDHYSGTGSAVSGENEFFLKYRRTWTERLRLGLE